MSVPSTSAAQVALSSTLVDEWVRHGLREAVVCPGSRSTPLVLALLARDDVTVHVRIDERSAGFFAIGCARRLGAPVLVVVTSGTAAMELHAAVAEAHHGAVPLIVATADRPPELHDVGALQTTRQREVYGPLVHEFAEPGVARDEARDSWRPLAARLWRSSLAAPPGPVHVNLAFVEPLVAAPSELPPAVGTAWAPPEPADEVPEVGGRVLVVAGPGGSETLLTHARERGWVVVGDATTPGTRPFADAILAHGPASESLRPDVVIRTGGLPTSKTVARRVREWGSPVLAVAGTARVADPDGVIWHGGLDASSRSRAHDPDYAAQWDAAVALVSPVAESLDEPAQMLSEPGVARAVARASASLDVPLVVGSSMPLRDVECWSDVRGRTIANRGLNGIDGVVSTALGVASTSRAIGLMGDVTFLHDVSGLVDGLGGAGRCALVVVDNGGGGIFAFLPQRRAVASDQFTRAFATPRSLDLVAVATSFGHHAVRVTSNAELTGAVTESMDRDGLTVVVARVPHFDVNVTMHAELNELARAALSDHFT